MKTHIYWIYFKNEELYKYIRNDFNNENWPKVKRYIEILKDWEETIQTQRSESDQIQAKNKKTKELAATVYSWFVEEYNRLSRERTEKCVQCDNARSASITKKEPKKCQGCGLTNWYHLRTKENPYYCEDLTPYLDFRQVYSQKYEQFQNFLVSLEDKECNLINNEKTEELSESLNEWNAHNEGHDIDSNPYEIFIHERTNDKISFIWRVPEIDTEIGPNRVFPNIGNFFFQLNGQYYEVSSWEQNSYETAKVVAKLSIFYNFYWSLIKSDVNGIFHFTPMISNGSEEVCFCPDYNAATNWHDFTCDYDLKLALFKADKTTVAGSKTYSIDDGVSPPSISALSIHKIDPREEVVGDLENSPFKTAWNNTFNLAIGTVYFLLSDRLGEEGGLSHLPPTSYKFRDSTKDNIDVGSFLHEKYDLNDPILYHFKRNHIKATLYWRKKQIWQGPYWLIHDNFRVEEICNASGIVISLWANNMIITRVTESITQKIGGNALVNKFIECAIDTSLNDDKGQNARQIERSVVSDTKSGGKEIHKESSTKTTTTTKDLMAVNKYSAGAKRLGSNALNPTLYSVDHTKSEYTSQQFEARYLTSGRQPLTARVEFSQIHLNQYRSRRELKGRPLYSYFNSDNFGTILDQSGYLQMTVISWNLGLHDDWFKEKLENGIYLYENEPKEFYRKKLTKGKNVRSASAGGTARGAYNMVQTVTNLKTSLGRDNLVHVDDLSWVWKVSFCRPSEGGTDIFPELIRQIALTSRLSPRSDNNAWKFDGYGNGRGEVAIPPNIEYSWFMRAFSTGDETKQKFTGRDKNGKLVLEQSGADWKLSFAGKFEIQKIVGDPETSEAVDELPLASNDPITIPPSMFNPETPSPLSRNIFTPPGGGGGEAEINIPDVDAGADIDAPSIDIDPGIDFDPPGIDIDPNNIDPPVDGGDPDNDKK